MSALIGIELSCGEKTCAESPGEFCQFFRQRMDGSRPYCALFDDTPLFDESGRDITGWIQRCDACLKANLMDATFTTEFFPMEKSK